MVNVNVRDKNGADQLSEKAQRLLAAHDREVKEQQLRAALHKAA